MHPAVPSVSAPPPPVLIGNEWTSCSVQVDAFVGMPKYWHGRGSRVPAIAAFGNDGALGKVEARDALERLIIGHAAFIARICRRLYRVERASNAKAGPWPR